MQVNITYRADAHGVCPFPPHPDPLDGLERKLVLFGQEMWDEFRDNPLIIPPRRIAVLGNTLGSHEFKFPIRLVPSVLEALVFLKQDKTPAEVFALGTQRELQEVAPFVNVVIITVAAGGGVWLPDAVRGEVEEGELWHYTVVKSKLNEGTPLRPFMRNQLFRKNDVIYMERFPTRTL